MDSSRFDALTRRLAQRVPRRQVLAGAMAAGARLVAPSRSAAVDDPHFCPGTTFVCYPSYCGYFADGSYCCCSPTCTALNPPCGLICCQSRQSCVDGTCTCTGQVCHGPGDQQACCAGNAPTCCNGVCCLDTQVCHLPSGGGVGECLAACPAGTTTCGQRCCPSGEACIGGACAVLCDPATHTVCGDTCCATNTTCCGSGADATCCDTGTHCCTGVLGATCCAAGTRCCGDACCAAGQVCLPGSVCRDGCPNGNQQCGFACCGADQACVGPETCSTCGKGQIGCGSVCCGKKQHCRNGRCVKDRKPPRHGHGHGHGGKH